MAGGRKHKNSNSVAPSSAPLTSTGAPAPLTSTGAPAPLTSAGAPAPQPLAPLVADIHDGIDYDATSFSSRSLKSGIALAVMKSSLNHEGNVVHGVAYDILVEHVKQTLAARRDYDVTLKSVHRACNEVYANEEKPLVSEASCSSFCTKVKKLGLHAQELTNARKGFPTWTKLFTEGTKEQRKEVWDQLILARMVDEAGFLDESADDIFEVMTKIHWKVRSKTAPGSQEASASSRGATLPEAAASASSAAHMQPRRTATSSSSHNSSTVNEEKRAKFTTEAGLTENTKRLNSVEMRLRNLEDVVFQIPGQMTAMQQQMTVMQQQMTEILAARAADRNDDDDVSVVDE